MPNYKKGTRGNIARNNPRKRRYLGNQFTDKEGEKFEASTSLNDSASGKKLRARDSEDIITNPLHGYRIIEFFTVFTALSEIVKCSVCNQKIRFSECGSRGLGFKIVVTCPCGDKKINSGPFINNGFEINRRIVFVMRLLGVAREGINIFCNLMDLCTGLSKHSYANTVQHIYDAAKSSFELLSQKAVEEEMEKNVEQGRERNILKVSGDGTWKKRGFKSKYGVATLIGYYSGKVIDLKTKSSYCQGCNYWKNKTHTEEFRKWMKDHEDECQKNHEGSSGKMEVDAMIEMFSTSEEKFGVKYGNYIGDGDSKTFKAILDSEPYGNELPIVKSECIGHVEKRMGSRLRNVRKEKKLSGRGKLTDKVVKKLTKYYGLSIQRNVNSVDEMKKAIMATYEHIFSTKEKPQHDNCPVGVDSWCKWQKAIALNQDPRNEDLAPLLGEDIKKHLLPIYQNLSKDDLLERCLGGHTQNANESFNATVWRLSPKHLHCGLKVVEISAYIAAGIFNEGYTSVLKIMNLLNLTIGTYAKVFAHNSDEERITRQNRKSLSETKDARTARRQHQMEENQLFEEAEGLLYGPGIAD